MLFIFTINHRREKAFLCVPSSVACFRSVRSPRAQVPPSGPRWERAPGHPAGPHPRQGPSLVFFFSFSFLGLGLTACWALRAHTHTHTHTHTHWDYTGLCCWLLVSSPAVYTGWGEAPYADTAHSDRLRKILLRSGLPAGLCSLLGCCLARTL